MDLKIYSTLKIFYFVKDIDSYRKRRETGVSIKMTKVMMRSAINTLFLTLSLTLTFLFGEIHVGTTNWKWIPHKMVRLT